jgi:hypothetical protein
VENGDTVAILIFTVRSRPAGYVFISAEREQLKVLKEGIL